MKIKRKKEKGFTLIELLITITILSLVVSISFFIISSVIKNSDKKKNEITVLNLKESATNYVKEFYTTSNYWSSIDKTNNEYACITISSLINKGILKDDILGTKVVVDDNEKTIEKETRIRIDRNTTTQAYEKTILFEDLYCSTPINFDFTFNITGDSNVGYEDWYCNDVTIKIRENNNNINKISDVKYTINNTEIENNKITINNQKSDNWNIEVKEQGKEINVCLQVTDIKGNEHTKCLEETNQQYNMDKTPPTSPILTLTTNESYQLESKGSTDNLTITDEIHYTIKVGNLVKGAIGETSKSLSSATRYENTDVITYTKDQAGNKSQEISKTLTIKDSTVSQHSNKTTWSCNVDGVITTSTNKEEIEKVCNKEVITELTLENTNLYSCENDLSDLTENYNDAKSLCTESTGYEASIKYFHQLGSVDYLMDCETEVGIELEGYGKKFIYPTGRVFLSVIDEGRINNYCGFPAESSFATKNTYHVMGGNARFCKYQNGRWTFYEDSSSQTNLGCDGTESTKTWFRCDNTGLSDPCAYTELSTVISSINVANQDYIENEIYEIGNIRYIQNKCHNRCTNNNPTSYYYCDNGKYYKTKEDCEYNVKTINTIPVEKYTCPLIELALDPVYYSEEYSYNRNGIDNLQALCKTNTTGTVTSSVKYICNGIEYQKESDAIEACTSCPSGTTKDTNGNCSSFK